MQDFNTLLTGNELWLLLEGMAPGLVAALTSNVAIIIVLLLTLAVCIGGVTMLYINFFPLFGRNGYFSKPTHFDPQRVFTSIQKLEGHARAGYRCELEGRFYRRCRQVSTHADHYFAYSRGGTSSMQNFVASCEEHNLAKGARMPKAAERWRLQRRRCKYFPEGVSVQAGEWTYRTRRETARARRRARSQRTLAA